MDSSTIQQQQQQDVDNRMVVIGVYHPNNEEAAKDLLAREEDVSFIDIASCIPDSVMDMFNPKEMYIAADREAPHGVIITDYTTDPPSQRLIQIPDAAGVSALNFTNPETGHHMTISVLLNNDFGSEVAEQVVRGELDAMSLSHDAEATYDKDGNIIGAQYKPNHIAMLNSKENPPGNKNCHVLATFPLHPEKCKLTSRLRDIMRENESRPHIMQNPRMVNMMSNLRRVLDTRTTPSPSPVPHPFATELSRLSNLHQKKFSVADTTAEPPQHHQQQQQQKPSAATTTDNTYNNKTSKNHNPESVDSPTNTTPTATSNSVPVIATTNTTTVSATAKESSKVVMSSSNTNAGASTDAPAASSDAGSSSGAGSQQQPPATNNNAGDKTQDTAADMDTEPTEESLRGEADQLRKELGWNDDEASINAYANWGELLNDPKTEKLARLVKLKLLEDNLTRAEKARLAGQVNELTHHVTQLKTQAELAGTHHDLQTQYNQLQKNVEEHGGNLTLDDIQSIVDTLKSISAISPEAANHVKQLEPKLVTTISKSNEAFQNALRTGGGGARVGKRTVGQMYEGQGTGVPDGGAAKQQRTDNGFVFYRGRSNMVPAPAIGNSNVNANAYKLPAGSSSETPSVSSTVQQEAAKNVATHVPRSHSSTVNRAGAMGIRFLRAPPGSASGGSGSGSNQ